MMKSETTEPLKTYATLRVTGDRLVPDQVKRLLKIEPTLAYAKGEHYAAGERSPDLIGRTGVWYFCTDGVVPSPRLVDHLKFLLWQVLPDPADMAEFRQFLRDKSLTAVVTCFWHGPAGAKRPSVPRWVRMHLKHIPALIEKDFDSDGEDSRHAA
jgi:hypothetical protein